MAPSRRTGVVRAPHSLCPLSRPAGDGRCPRTSCPGCSSGQVAMAQPVSPVASRRCRVAPAAPRAGKQH